MLPDAESTYASLGRHSFETVRHVCLDLTQVQCAQVVLPQITRLKEIEAESELLKADIENEKKRIKELEEQIAAEKAARKADKEAREKLAEQMKAVGDDKKSLEAELALTVDQIGFLSEYSTKKK